jgi:molybdate transport system ATP-binding protein
VELGSCGSGNTRIAANGRREGGTLTGLEAHIVVRRDEHTVDVAFDAAPGEVVVVVGPNGAGKSTIVKALAGLVPIDDGRIILDGVDLATRTAQERHVGLVFQQRLLFPHLTALANVAFGPRSRGAGRKAAEAAAQQWLDRLGIGDLAQRKPARLSGGQAQRVAVARALVTSPDVLLLDEPFAALDVGVAMGLRLELAEHLKTFPGVCIVVTHDAIDAMMLADTVIVLDEGRIAQRGTPDQVAQRPRTEHVARLLGMNMLGGRSDGTRVRLADGTELVTSTPHEGAVHACFSPSAVTITTTEPNGGSARNHWRGRIGSAVPHGAAVRLHLDAAGGLIADVTPESASRLGLAPGAEVWAAVKATEIQVYAASD